MPAHHSCAGILSICDIYRLATLRRIAEPSQRFPSFCTEFVVVLYDFTPVEKRKTRDKGHKTKL